VQAEKLCRSVARSSASTGQSRPPVFIGWAPQLVGRLP